jgi:hypothetical protein
MWRRIFTFVSSLKLTIFCLAAALLLVFAGTLAQVNSGIHAVQERYFQSLLVWWPPDATGFKIPVFPGGHLLGAILLVNLVAAHLRRFRWTWNKLGIHLTHAGLIIMLLGGLFTDLFSVESHMRLEEGQTRNYSEDSRRIELAVVDRTGSDVEQVTAIPEKRLQRGATLQIPELPFRIVIREFYRNSRIEMLDKPDSGAAPAADQGLGARLSVRELPRASALNDNDVKSAVIEIVPLPAEGQAGPASLGTWLVSDALGAPQEFACAGRPWRLEMRPARYYKPYSLTLQKFTHERYQGTEIPKNFASRVTLADPGQNENRDVLIYMNHPLRYRGDTYYQSGFDRNETATILQVVHNPGFLAPYTACVVVGAGLLVQFAMHFAGFSRRRRAEAAG